MNTKTQNPQAAGTIYSQITSPGQLAPLETHMLFDNSFSESNLSPIDQFIENTNKLNKLFAIDEPDTVTSNLIFLGYMSAVESYMRSLVRRVINTDEVAYRLVATKEVTFGAALHHTKDMLPEALIEHMSLAGERGIVDVVKELIGVKGQIPEDLKMPLAEYKKICELRHCVVHRFGKLGAKNAIALGLDTHNMLFEKPITLDSQSLQDIAQILRVFVKAINNYVFRSILERSARNKDDKGNKLYFSEWTWNAQKDKKRFQTYYNIFSSHSESPASPCLKDVYNDFRNKFRIM